MSRGSQSPALHALAVLTAGATFGLLFLGGLVTSTGSGLAVPDWPLSFGQWLPAMTGGVLFEHGHRLAASFVGFLTLALAIWVVATEPRPHVRVLALAAVFAVVLQGILGGVTVLYKLPTIVSVTHACLAQIFFCLILVLVSVTAPAWRQPAAAIASSLPLVSALAVGCTLLQLILGASVRHLHAGLAIPDFPLAFGHLVPPFSTPFVTLHFAHRVGALVVAAAALTTTATAWRHHRRDPFLLRPALLLLVLVASQVLLGGMIVWSHRAVLPTTLHQTTGAAVLGACVVVALRARHRNPSLASSHPRAIDSGALAA